MIIFMSFKKKKINSGLMSRKATKTGLEAKMHFLHKNVQFSVAFVSLLYKMVSKEQTKTICDICECYYFRIYFHK